MTTEHDITMTAGGIAQWGRALPMRDKMTTVTFEADLMTKIVSDDNHNTTFFRTIYIGMDEVDVDGSTPSGYGNVRLEDPQTGDLLIGRVEWYMKDGKDKGDFTFDTGTGAWAGANGRIPVDLEFCSHTSDDALNGGDAVKGLAFVEGTGRLAFDQ